MSVLKISGPVRRVMGRDAAALDAGVGLPADAQCWHCGEAINLLAARPGSVTLSAVRAAELINISAFGHAEHTSSRIFTPEQFQALASTKPSPVAGGDSNLLIEGRSLEDATIDGDRIVFEQNPALREHLLGLAAQVEAAGGDEEALRIMREATGLSMTDPEADRQELAMRAERRREAEQNRAAGVVIHCVRCPSCGQLPDLVISPSQAYCGYDPCEALQYSPEMPAFEQLANRSTIPGLIGDVITPEMAAAADRRRPVQVPGSAEDDVREAEIRDYFHSFGYRCAPESGHCALCHRDPKGMNDGE